MAQVSRWEDVTGGEADLESKRLSVKYIEGNRGQNTSSYDISLKSIMAFFLTTSKKEI